MESPKTWKAQWPATRVYMPFWPKEKGGKQLEHQGWKDSSQKDGAKGKYLEDKSL